MVIWHLSTTATEINDKFYVRKGSSLRLTVVDLKYRSNGDLTPFRHRERLDKEAFELTSIGNSFQIRHTETQQTPLELSEHVDYLFHRLFSMVWLILRTTNRGG